MRPANHNHRTIALEQILGTAELSIVVEAHAVTVGPCIMNHYNIALLHFGQHAVDGKLVVVLAQRPGYIIGMVARHRILSHHGDMVIGTIQGGTHKIRHRCIKADIVLVLFRYMQDFADKVPIWTGDHPSTLEDNLKWIQACRNNHALIELMHIIADLCKVHRLLVGTVWYADAASHVDELNAYACLFVDADGKVEEHAGGLNDVRSIQFVGCNHGMKTKVLDSLLFHDPVAIDDLGRGHPVLSLHRVADDGIAGTVRTGIIPETDGIGSRPNRLLERFYVGNIIQVDDGPEVIGRLEFLRRGVIAGKHDFFAGDAASLGKQQFRQGGAVCSEPLLGQELENGWVGTSFYRIVIAKTGCPSKESLETPSMLDHRFFIVQVERGRQLGSQLEHLSMTYR